METPRLLLRPFELKTDLAAIYQIFANQTLNKFLPWFPLETEADAVAFYQEQMTPVYTSGKGYFWAICLKDNTPIGYVTVSGNDSHDLGYGLLPAYWNQGLVTEAAAYVLSILKKQYPFVTATHDRENPASGRVMQKLGLSYRYSYREQWQPKDVSVVFRLYQKDFQEVPTFSTYWEQYPDHFIETI